MREGGKIKSWIPSRGFGFCIPDAGGNDVFVHSRRVRGIGADGLWPGQRITFELGTAHDGRLEAQKVELVDD